jgi:hypothetical protein
MVLRREVVVRRKRWLRAVALLGIAPLVTLSAGLGTVLGWMADLGSRPVVIVAEPVAAPRPEPPDPAPRCEPLEVRTTVARAVAASWLADPGAPTHSARIMPAFRHHTLVGVKVYAVRPGAAWSVLGIRNGDTVRRVDGLEVWAASHVEQILPRLVDAAPAATTIELERRGCPVTIVAAAI